VLAWLLGKSIDLDEMFQAQLLSSVLLDNSASPLMQVLETSELGSSPSPLCGLEDSSREMSFICGLEGCTPDATDAVETLIRATLERIAETGVPDEQVEAALHQLELHQREVTGDGHPYGLQLIITGLSSAIHGGDPIRLLDIDPALARLREQIKDPDFIPGLIRRLLLSNSHHVVLTLNPDAHMAGRQVEAATERLQRIKNTLSDEEAREIVERSQQLAERQQSEDDPGILPKVGLDDVPAELPLLVPEKSIITAANMAMPISFYGQGTNGLAYQQIVVELPHLDDDLLTVLPYYTTCVSEFGIGERSYAEVQTWQSRISGGINCYANIRSNVDDEQHNKAIVVFSSKALANNHSDLSDLLFQTFAHLRFDEIQRLREIIDQVTARRESSITGQGHSLAMSLASSGMSPSAHLNHRFTGLAGINTLRALGKSIRNDDEARALLDKFRRIHELIQNAPRQVLLISEPGGAATLQQHLAGHWSSFGAATAAANGPAFAALQLPSRREPTRQIWATNTQVNFCAKAFPTVPAGHADHATLSVLAG